MFWDSTNALLRIVVVGVPMYFLMIAALRITGKRALAKMNAYDLVITVSLGSVLASTFLQKDIRLSDGVLALGLMLSLQYVVAFAAQKWSWVQPLVLAEPRLLLFDGEPIQRALRRERITRSELLSAVRSHGHMSLDDVIAVVLEPDGSFSAIPRQKETDATAMATVSGFPKSLANRQINTGKGEGSSDSKEDELQPSASEPLG